MLVLDGLLRLDELVRRNNRHNDLISRPINSAPALADLRPVEHPPARQRFENGVTTVVVSIVKPIPRSWQLDMLAAVSIKPADFKFLTVDLLECQLHSILQTHIGITDRDPGSPLDAIIEKRNP